MTQPIARQVAVAKKICRSRVPPASAIDSRCGFNLTTAEKITDQLLCNNLCGNINANTVVVRGKVTGNISAKEKIELKAKTELFGDVRSAKLVMEEGVTFVGKTEVNPNKVAPSPSPRPPSLAMPEAAKQRAP